MLKEARLTTTKGTTLCRPTIWSCLPMIWSRPCTKSHPLNIQRPLRALLAQGRYGEVTRLDVAILVRVPDGVTKSALINAVALANVVAGANMSLFVNESTYGDPSSQLRAWKLYDRSWKFSAGVSRPCPILKPGRP